MAPVAARCSATAAVCAAPRAGDGGQRQALRLFPRLGGGSSGFRYPKTSRRHRRSVGHHRQQRPGTSSLSSPGEEGEGRTAETAEDEEEEDEESLNDFVSRVCRRLGRGADDAEAIVVKLRANWLERPADLATVSTQQLSAIGIPARFGQEMTLTLQEDEAGEMREAASSSEDDADASLATPTLAEASQAADGWVGGDLPGPHARLSRPTTRDGPALSEVRVTARRRLPPYGLRDDRIPKSLATELETLRRDLTGRRVGGGKAPVRQTTANNYVNVAKGLMGWYVRVKRNGWDGVSATDDAVLASPPEGLSLRDAIPSESAEGAGLAIEYLQWLCEVRGIAAKTEDFQLRSLIAVAKWLYGRGEAVQGGGDFDHRTVREDTRRHLKTVDYVYLTSRTKLLHR